MDMINAHAQTTLKHHFRPDNSCFHVVSYDTITGLPHAKIHIKAMRMSLHGPGARHGHCMVIQ